MTQVIIHENENGGVSVTKPSLEALEQYGIDWIKNKDTPNNSIIIDDSTLPQGADGQFFNAWELNGSEITINFSKAQEIKLSQYNAAAIIVSQNRQLNTLSGIENIVDDATWLNKLKSDRAIIASSTTTEQLIAIENPS